MLLELHFAKDTLTLKFLLQGTKSLFDIVVANTYLHVVFTTFLSLSFMKCRRLPFSKPPRFCPRLNRFCPRIGGNHRFGLGFSPRGA